ncbi:hypothetical protein TWF694_005135 [Orbilia ellipsospora]|uniref:IgE-binding protein n=1 Tax=Orbilia ellipsospora TaxID=2528407 RepID=A0AAV9WVP4_9PEZI
MMLIFEATVLLSFVTLITAIPEPVPAIKIENGIPRAPAPLLAGPNGASNPSFNGKSLTASEGTFWIGKPTGTSCSLPDHSKCPKGTDTAVNVWLAGTVNMSVAVAGGQQVYIGPNGALSYTKAGAPPNSMPKYSITRGFCWVKDSKGTVTLESRMADGSWLACPVDQNSVATGPWKVYKDRTYMKGSDRHYVVQDTNVPSGKKSDCVSFNIIGTPGTISVGAAAYEYT